jgi:hypothetical protein
LIVAVPGRVESRKVTVHVAVASEPERLQGEPAKFPGRPVSEKSTLPSGVIGEPIVDVSFTVALQVVSWLTTIEPMQEMAIEVALGFTVTVASPLPPL